MSTQYATYFDQHFLTRGLVLLESIQSYDRNSVTWVLCLDDRTYEVLHRLTLSNVRLLKLRDLEAFDKDLKTVKSTRSVLEYYYTITAPFLRYLLHLAPSISTLIYVDADHCFFSNPKPLLSELGDGDIGIIDHRYPEIFSNNYVFGRYNVGILIFRRSPTTDACIARWRQQCLDWCYDYLDNGRYGDQRYLDEWPNRYPGVRVLQHKGSGVALWNATNYPLTVRDDRVYVDNVPLITYHFSRFRILSRWLFDTGARCFGYEPSPPLKYGVYAPYARAIQRATRRVELVTQVGGRDTVRPRSGHGAWFGGEVLAEKLHILGASLIRRSLLLVVGRYSWSVLGPTIVMADYFWSGSGCLALLELAAGVKETPTDG